MRTIKVSLSHKKVLVDSNAGIIEDCQEEILKGRVWEGWEAEMKE